MKDIVLSPVQIETASKVGANAVLLIQALFDRGHCDHHINEMITLAHSKNLEVLLETHNEKEFQSAINTDADLIGINNRNLGTLKVDLDVTMQILKNNYDEGKIIGFGVDKETMSNVLKDGKAFQTSGCPDCNRPYYNERPSGPFYNYPRMLTTAEAEKEAKLFEL